ncbi:MAG: thiamine diphosphokinase [Bacteroidales bacterium]|nr:thiamine diphosphokinase [Bacteroidales bacterium]
MNVVILAAGVFPRTGYSWYLMGSADALVCCDGALKIALKNKLKPTAVVGDMDSVSKIILNRFNGEIVKVDEQDDNDLTKAMKYVLEKYPEVAAITILGGTGKREAHTLGNLSLLMEYEKEYGFWERGVTVQMVSDHSTAFAVGDSTTISVGEGRAVSLFTCDPTLRVRSRGLQWPLDDVVFDNWWKATLNRATSDEIALEFNHPAPMLIILD